ncbi:hypothetical protein [Streptomyces sp. NPDC048650]|uniref:hypothetical protein n=1 Tax=Streptomyces sp. NPDC048650 TaxID=3365583 RepID=UPI003713EE0F
MTDEHSTADDTAPRRMPSREQRRRARQALAGRARDADDLSLLMDMLGLDPAGDPCHDVAQEPEPGPGPVAGRERRSAPRRDTCAKARSRPSDPG